jgi:hypothetical protein
MSPHISTLIPDIYVYVSGLKDDTLGERGRDAVVKEFLEACQVTIYKFLEERKTPQEFRIRPSSLGTPDRKLWFMARQKPGYANPSSRPITFLYGSLTEALILLLCKLAGHEVTDFQKEVTLGGIKGSLDAVIDGELVDVKSASPYSYAKFKSGEFLMPHPEVDPFGYKDQISFYARGTEAEKGSFLVTDKSSGELTLCIVDEDTGLKPKGDVEARIKRATDVINMDAPPPQLCYEPVPFGKGGNMEINRLCAMCPFKVKGGCFPSLRAFKYSNGIKYLSHVVKEPEVPEVFLDD